MGHGCVRAKFTIGIDGKTHTGPDVVLVRHGLTGNTTGNAQPNPLLDPAFLSRFAIMVGNPLNPLSSHFAQRTIRQDRRILPRNIALIIKPVNHPEPDRIFIELSRVHPDVERMQMVVTLGIPPPEAVRETLLWLHASWHHNSIVIPSSATWIPFSFKESAFWTGSPKDRVGVIYVNVDFVLCALCCEHVKATI